MTRLGCSDGRAEPTELELAESPSPDAESIVEPRNSREGRLNRVGQSSSAELNRSAYAACDGESGVPSCGAAAYGARAAWRRCSISSDSDVRSTVPPYWLITGSTLSGVTRETNTKIAELFGVI